MRDIAAGAAALLAPIAAFGKGILQQGLAQAGSFEQTMVEMETMLGSAEEAKEALSSLTKFAVETPFEMPQLISVAKQLIMFGERGDEMMGTLKMLGDASGGTAERFGLLGSVFNQIRGATKLLTQDFRQMSTRGIISLQDIAKHYKVTTAAANAMLSNGKISFDDLRKILLGLTQEGGRFHNMMIKQSTTLVGLNSTLNDTLNIAKRTLAEPLVPFMKELVSAAILLSNALESTVRHGGELVSFAVVGTTVFSTLGASLFGAFAAMRLFGISIGQFFVGVRIASGIALVGAAIGLLVGWIRQTNDVLAPFTAAWRRIGEFFSHYVNAFNAFVQANRGTINEIKMLFFEILTNLMSIFTEVFNAIGSGFASVLPSADDFLTFLENSLYELREILDWISLFTTNWRTTWELAKAQFDVVMAHLKLYFYEFAFFAAMQTMKAAISMVDAIRSAVTSVGKMFGVMVSSIGDLFSALWKGLKESMATFFLSTLPNMLSAAIQMIQGFYETMNEARKKAIMARDPSIMFDAWKKQFDKVKDHASNMLKGINVPGKDMFAGMSDKFGADFNAAMAKINPAAALKGMMVDLNTNRGKAIVDLVHAQTRRDQLLNDLRKERDKKREGKLSDAGVITVYQRIKTTPEPDMSNADILKPGRYSFQEFGHKIQDALLKDDKKDLQKQMVDIGRLGLGKQDEIIKAIGKSAPKGLVAPGGG